ncbi:MAG TPA: translocation/assembly module TamB domain-containing protein [Meiothermus sp.]|nr:translocation/assembly module TamB domain-containing protein [Meiothermus sp.]
MRFRRFWPLLIPLVLVLLPAAPPLLDLLLKQGLAAAGFQGQWTGISGYLFTGVRLRDGKLQGPGIRVDAKEVVIDYQLFGLLRRELPIRIRVKGATANLEWDQLIPEKVTQQPPPPFRLLVEQLDLENVEATIAQGQRLPIPKLRLSLRGRGPEYGFRAQTPDGAIKGTVKRTGLEFESWEIRFEGEVRAARFWYPGLERGRLEGTWKLGPQGVFGDNYVHGGRIKIPGVPFLAEDLEGPIDFVNNQVTARLSGRTLDGPVQATARVDIPKLRYTFHVEGTPSLPALAKSYGLSLPVEGRGPLSLDGEGWEKVRLKGQFRGEGTLVGQPLTYAGSLALDKTFTLQTQVRGRFFDRDYQAGVNLESAHYRVNLTDNFGSQLALQGAGDRASGGGSLVWPAPLKGTAQLAFDLERGRWNLGVRSPGVGLPLAQPLDLSGRLRGEGNRVSGGLGPVRLAGTWENLALAVSKLPLVVGEVAATGSLRGGRLSADLAYTSPYASFPVAVRQQGAAWLLSSPNASGHYEGGVFTLSVNGQPLTLIEPFQLFGKAVYRNNTFSGDWRLVGERLEARGVIENLATRFSGAVRTPVGTLPLSGRADSGGVWAQVSTLNVTAGAQGVRVQGPLEFSLAQGLEVSLRSDLTYRNGEFSGTATAATPYLSARLEGRGQGLWATTRGYAELSGPVFPDARLSGRLTLPDLGAVQIPNLLMHVTRNGATIGESRVDFKPGFPFRVVVPARIGGIPATLRGMGNLEGGNVAVRLPWGEVRGSGNWRDLRVTGELAYEPLGQSQLSGTANLFEQSYALRLALPKLDGALRVFGKGANLAYAGSFQDGHLEVSGAYRAGAGRNALEGLRLRVNAENFDLEPFGIPFRLSGTWGEGGGLLHTRTAFGDFEVRGQSLLGPLEVSGVGEWGRLSGTLDAERVSALAQVKLPGLEGRVDIAGPWSDLEARGQGRYDLPYLEQAEWRLEANVNQQTWQLSGPLALFGRGLEYRGQIVSWGYAVAGERGELSGRVSGKGTQVQAEAQTTYRGIPMEVSARTDRFEVAAVKADLRLPGGEAHFAEGKVSFDLETAPIAKVLELPVSGRLAGSLDVEGLLRGDHRPPPGQAKGRLKAWGESVDLTYQGRQVRVFLPERNVGANAEIGEEIRLEALGDLSGQVRLEPDLLQSPLSGELRYAIQGNTITAQLAGTVQVPQMRAEVTGSWGQVVAQIAGDLKEQTTRGTLEVRTSWADAGVVFHSEKTHYTAVGNLESKQYLEQTGPVSLEGEGLVWKLDWKAPLGVQAGGEGLDFEQVRLLGANSVKVAERNFDLQGDLTYRRGAASANGTFAGRMAVSSPGIRLDLRGEGRRLWAEGEAFEVKVAASSDDRGNLGGSLSYIRTLGPSRLEATAQLSGNLQAPKLEGRGRVLGQGKEIALRFSHAGEFFARAEGEGLDIRVQGPDLLGAGALEKIRLSVDLDTDLEPFTGVPVHLRTQAEGPWQTLVFPIAVRGFDTQATGEARLQPLQARLEGTYQGQGFRVIYQDGLSAELTGPYLRGRARWGEAGPIGELAVEVPLPGGGLRGQADLSRMQADLRGFGDWRGTVSARLPGGWREPTRVRLEADLKGAAEIQGDVQAELSPLALEGQAVVRYPEWGGVRLEGRGPQVQIQGQGGVEPLTGSLDLAPLRLTWSYVGELPKSLGKLQARGVYPGVWLQGQYQNSGKTLGLRGEGERVQVSGEGLQGQLTTQGPSLRLQNFTLGPAVLSGTAGGKWLDLDFDLAWKALGRAGEARGSYSDSRLQAQLSGDLAGQVAWGQTWSGHLRIREGEVQLSGSEAIPQVSGEFFGLQARLNYPVLEVETVASQRSGESLRANLLTRQAQGRLVYQGVEVTGSGDKLTAGYPLADGRLQGELDLNTFALVVSAPDLGQGSLGYVNGGLEGQITARLYGVDLTLRGAGQKLQVMGSHAVSDWLSWGAGRFEGEVGLSTDWRLSYQAEGQTFQAKGQGLEGQVQAQGRWIQGELAYSGDWKGALKLDVPLKPLESRLKGELAARSPLQVSAVLSGAIGQINLNARLDGGLPVARAELASVALGDLPWLHPAVPYLSGRVSGAVDYREGNLGLTLQAQSLRVVGDETPLSMRLEGTWKGGEAKGDLLLGKSTARLTLSQGQLSGRVQAVNFPLHWLLSAWAGELKGQAFWTGKASFRYNFLDPWASQGLLVGEQLRFEGGGDALAGQAVLRYEKERLDIDKLALSGKGTWRGEGYWSRQEGSRLKLDLQDTSFTPVLQVIPTLKPFAPEGSGTLRLSSDGNQFALELEKFRFKLGPVAGEFPQARLRLGETAVAEGTLNLSAPYPAQARLSGEGSLESFLVRAQGTAQIPLLEPNQRLSVEFRYPGYVTTVSTETATLSGTVFPLAMGFYGEIPVSAPRYYLQEGRVRVNGSLNQEEGVFRLRGNVEVLRARLALPEGQQEVSVPVEDSSKPARAPIGSRSGDRLEPEPGGAAPVEFVNLRITAERGVLFQEALAQGELAGDLYLNGTLSDPFLSGEVRPLRGEVRLWNNVFTLRESVPDEGGEFRSVATFSPEQGIFPVVSVAASASQVRDQASSSGATYDVLLKLRGRFVRENGRARFVVDQGYPQLTATGVSGQPVALSQAQIYGLLTLGRSDLENVPESLLQTGLQAALQNFLFGQIERELAKALGLEQVRIEVPNFSGGDFRFENTSLSFGIRIAPEVLLRTTFAFTGEGIISAEYRLDGFTFTLGTRFVSETTGIKLRPEFSLGYSILSNLDLSLFVRDDTKPGGDPDVRFGLGLNLRF